MKFEIFGRNILWKNNGVVYLYFGLNPQRCMKPATVDVGISLGTRRSHIF